MDNGEWRTSWGNGGVGEGRENVVRDKLLAFAVRVVKLSRWLREAQHEFVLSQQLLRSGTAIGALVREADQAESRSDFCHKMAIALKEASETDYWLDLLHQTQLLDDKNYRSIQPDIIELIKLLTTIVKTSRTNR